MYRKEQVDQLTTTLHAAVEELGAILLMNLQAAGGAQQGQQQQNVGYNPQQAQQNFQQQPQGQQQQFNPQQGTPQGQQQQAAGAITSDMILQLLHSPVRPGGPNLVDDPNGRPLLQAALQQFGIGSLPEAKPEHYAGLYQAFQGVLAQLGQQGAPQGQQQGYAPQGGQQGGQQGGYPQQGQQFQPQGQQGGYPQQQQGYAPQGQQQFQPQGGYNPQQQGGGLV